MNKYGRYDEHKRVRLEGVDEAGPDAWRCPSCQTPLTGATGIRDPETERDPAPMQPKAGDVTICSACEQVLVFLPPGGERRLAAVSEDEIATWPPEITSQLRAAAAGAMLDRARISDEQRILDALKQPGVMDSIRAALDGGEAVVIKIGSGFGLDGVRFHDRDRSGDV